VPREKKFESKELDSHAENEFKLAAPGVYSLIREYPNLPK
jgi:hypothetical protein